MLKKINILVVDDHPMTVDAYVNIISLLLKDRDVKFIKANCGQEAYRLLEMSAKLNENINLALIDLGIPSFAEKNILSGADIARSLRMHFSSCKIVILTMHNEPLLIQNVFKSINPEGFISKNDINFLSFPHIISKILNGGFHKSQTIINSIQQLVYKNINWDENDSKIIILLSQGYKTKDLTRFINLSLSAIEKRKASIKDQLLGNKGSDKKLLLVAKELNLI
jgi:DNA-binding NarL/FixJ family response regulator